MYILINVQLLQVEGQTIHLNKIIYIMMLTCFASWTIKHLFCSLFWWVDYLCNTKIICTGWVISFWTSMVISQGTNTAQYFSPCTSIGGGEVPGASLCHPL